ncbi:hypothetical protein ILUMI_25233 [Ignelater luminosus]|uniref:Uncharacterized protein n=1 Tax=Ignelater luminosus TaxID=2038154 RepID=A0A8K0C8Z0_IGNLU|nr:hypothetical protein ILUMI_25233 [Ignelater luminosus]
MAQRIRSCTNHTKMDTMQHLSKTAKRDRPQSASGTVHKQSWTPRCSRNQIDNCGPLVPTISSSLKSKSGTIRQQPQNTATSPNLIRKELDNSALVEVTVRTHTSKKPHNKNDLKSSTQQQPWGKLLNGRKGTENVSSFSDFDPLRTLHFLAKELQSKLKKNGLDDPHTQKIVLDMQQALTRIPPELTSNIQLDEIDHNSMKQFTNEVRRKTKKKSLLNNEIETAVSGISEQTGQKASLHFDLEDLILNGFSTENKHPIRNTMELPEKLLPALKPTLVNRYSQTVSNGIVAESEIFQRQLAAGTKKLEKTCKDMESLCVQLKTEKEELELLLLAEKDTVKFLRKQIQDIETEKDEINSYKIEQLTHEKNNLNAQVRKLQAQLEAEQGLPVQELRSLVQQLQQEKTNIEQENMSLKHQLTISNMEKEKYIAILSVRDRQINEIRTEMTQLQDVVNEQLFELQKSPFVSSPSSQSTIVGNLVGVPWQQTPISTKIDKEIGDNLSMSPDNSDSPIQQLFDKDMQMMHLFREVPSGDFTSASNLESLASKMKKNESEVLSTGQMKMVSGKGVTAVAET